ncbi:M15 family metallopeptidase [Actinoplanes sp. NPDC024001]|uniref:M15 family metallopeptidase n=1 Tax=Actinoplanes sp. NPDC024001 TaxID=3154598 RepID=UPI0033CFF05D
MNGNGRIARIAGPALALALAVGAAPVPAQAAATTTAGKAPAAKASAGTTWAQVMRRKLGLDIEATKLTTALPAMRVAVTARTSDVALAQRAELAAAAALATATTTDQNARTRLATAKTAAAAAKKAVTAAQKLRPRKPARVTKAKKALAAAEAAVHTRAAAVKKSTAARTAAAATHSATARQVTAAVTAQQAATAAVTKAERRIASIPALRTTFAQEATALSGQVVTQSRANFTVAQTTKVYGVTVNKVVAYPFQRMIDDAARAGIKISGGGFRTKEQQIALRKSNSCPDVWTAPASSCRVPTAIPGRSLHEVGLAVDLTSGGKSINTRKSPAFKWLAANAGRYGFVNLPSEPWHWSITGS